MGSDGIMGLFEGTHTHFKAFIPSDMVGVGVGVGQAGQEKHADFRSVDLLTLFFRPFFPFEDM